MSAKSTVLKVNLSIKRSSNLFDLLELFIRIFQGFSLFNYQCSLCSLTAFAVSSIILPCSQVVVNNFFHVFSSFFPNHLLHSFSSIRKRRGWDSNPRALADKRFSRPPRYDHFDTSAYLFKCNHLIRIVRCLTRKIYTIILIYICQQ